MCMGQTPSSRLAQACRAAAAELPRPTVRRWCEHGYNAGYSKTVVALKEKFRVPKEIIPHNIPIELDHSTVTKQEESTYVFEGSILTEQEKAPETFSAIVAGVITETETETETLAIETTDNNESETLEDTTSIVGATIIDSRIIANISIVFKGDDYTLTIHEKDNLENVVQMFCETNAEDSISDCVE
ncbi:unnamed protein product [Sphagnum jensenii]|uniref:Uncharacterized protein n=2 Tax=Sphagnum jensenii TaxID=128206 RepID=A0ABP1A3U8_9BRYO